MATTLSFLAHCLDERDWHYSVEANHNCIITGVKGDNVERLPIVLQLSENGEYLQIQAPMLLQVKDSVYKRLLMQTMAHIEYQVKMLRLEYDPADGEIRASVELPLEDAVLTQRQFHRCLSGLVQIVDEVAIPRLKTVLATGEDPGMPALEQRLLDALPPEMLAMMERLVALKQRQGD